MTPRLLTLVLLLGASACSAGSPEVASTPDFVATDPSSAFVEIERSRFDTPRLTVPAGSTVTFTNRDPYGHTVTSDAAAPIEFDSGDLGEGDAFTVTFDEPGEYPYFCRIHPTMRATVIVT